MAVLRERVPPPHTNEAELRLPAKATVSLSESISESEIPPIRDSQAQL